MIEFSNQPDTPLAADPTLPTPGVPAAAAAAPPKKSQENSQDESSTTESGSGTMSNPKTMAGV